MRPNGSFIKITLGMEDEEPKSLFLTNHHDLLFSALGIKIAGADMKLLIYSPFYIIGYKHFLDFTMLKALFDIILGRGHYMKRESVSRVGGMQQVKPKREIRTAVKS